MTIYKLFYTDKELPAGARPDFTFVMPLDFVTKDDALNQAFKLIYSGAIAWKIEGPDGFYLDRDAIEHEYRTFKSR